MAQTVNTLPEMKETQALSLGSEIPGERNGYQLHYSYGEFHGQGSQCAI